MPGSHGGGGSHGGSHGSSHGGSGGTTFSRTRPFRGARRYHYYNHLGASCFFYSSIVPVRKDPKKIKRGFIIGIVAAIVFFAVIIYLSLPHKLAESKCHEEAFCITDNASVLGDTTELVKQMDAFYEKSGVQLYIYTDTVDNYKAGGNYYSSGGIENFSYDEYLKVFSDEGHWMLTLITTADKSDFLWCDMYGDDTGGIITETLFNTFSDSFQADMENDSVSINTAFMNALVKVTDDVLSFASVDIAGTLVGPIFGLLLVILVIVLTGKSYLKEIEDINEYCDHRDKNGGVDDVYDIDPKEYEA